MGTGRKDQEITGGVVPFNDGRWREWFALDRWTVTEEGADRFLTLTYELGLVSPAFEWPRWFETWLADPAADDRPLTAADAVRVITSYVRAERMAGGYPADLVKLLVGGRLGRAFDGVWAWCQEQAAPCGSFVDWSAYSEDKAYRWWYERRWAPGPALCWVGLNPATGDTDGKPRPTLAKVVNWARRAGCSAVVVVNLFAWRATNPAELAAAPDPVGTQNDDVIRRESKRAGVTLVAWGAHKAAADRGLEVLPIVESPVCAGTTKAGQPRHPLYVSAATELEPYFGP